ncbi:hypothetical protein HNQ40_002509 [Algisphaera agarilytica]|uniref:Uncharacterized protein n=1 Tax=Algisphaera agarilytica TaxID=1385975 RepID=A0A7X0H7H3_9BACT|nr:hypothetical protein [Algisphaera agarilytica]
MKSLCGICFVLFVMLGLSFLPGCTGNDVGGFVPDPNPEVSEGDRASDTTAPAN